MLTKISLVNKIKKYFKYLSESPAKNSLGPEHVSGLRLFLSGDSDKYLKYFLILLTRIMLNQTGKLSVRDTA
jgi:hypothetical protein